MKTFYRRNNGWKTFFNFGVRGKIPPKTRKNGKDGDKGHPGSQASQSFINMVMIMSKKDN
jgi:hypothetical protein